MKKTFASITIALLLIIVLVSTVFAAPTGSAKEFALKGSLETKETQRVVLPTLFVNATGSGNATHMGLLTMSSRAEVEIPALTSSTWVTLVAADGSTLSGEGAGQGTPTAIPSIVLIVETYTITGGTGRFEGASGSFIVERVLNRATGISSGTINGTIVLP